MYDTENGTINNDVEFAELLARVLEADISPNNSWRVDPDENGRLYWESGAGKVHR